MIKHTCLIASIMIALAFATVASSADRPISIWLANDFSGPVHFEVDGKYSCDAPGYSNGMATSAICYFDPDCKSTKTPAPDICIPAVFDRGPHTVVVSWAGKQYSQRVELEDPDSDDIIDCTFFDVEGTGPFFNWSSY